MIAVIFGLVAVVLLVLVVVALGMRSMNRRESNLPPERLRKMAEQADDPNAKRPGRPAEETFFESFPEGFDAFQEPERAVARLRSGANRPASRPAGRPGGRPAPRGKQAASSRGRRGVDEWGDADDYDDDYWSRVRADDGAFGGTIAARMGASRPDVASPSAAATPKPTPPKEREEFDANATTVQAPLPARPAGLADLVEPARNTAASDRTVTFPAPVPQASAAEVLGAIGATQASARTRRGSRPDPADPLGVADAARAKADAAARAKPRRRPDAGGDPGRTNPGRGADARRTDARRTAPGRDAGRPEPGRAPGRPEPVRADSGPTGPFATGRPGTGPHTATGPFPADPLSGGPMTTGPLPGGPLAGGGLSRGSFAADPLSSGPLSGGAASPGQSRNPAGASRPGGLSGGPRPPEAPRPSGGGAFDAGRSSTGSYETPRAGDPRGGSFPAAPTYDPIGSGAANAATGEFPSAGSWPSQPAYQATGSYDILDGPAVPAASASNETWKSADYQLPTYEPGYAPREGYTPEPPYTPAPSAPSYEVRPGWATIDDSDGATPPSGRAVSAFEPNGGRDLPPPPGSDDSLPGAGQGFGYEADRYSASGPASSWPQPRQSAGGSWPSYGELYGNSANGGLGADQSTQSSQASPSRGGHRRPAETDYPDYYR
ncbi:hypothetical protein [Sphaerisporangium corydalis]|uniref:hypothetical protein n=1 Tax=Sphaerisporangium corydalis TaxID=1441875 RepID=UPI0021D161B2|nr:hypothetical protein [Sphaerisporangium corydalis]